MRLKKGLNTEQKIVKAAIKCIGTVGLHRTTFQMIADKGKVSQPLVMHYFKNKESIFPKVWECVYQDALKKTSHSLSLKKSACEKLKEYIFVSWEQFNSDKSLSNIYMQLHSLSVFDDGLRITNSYVKRHAINRIAGIIGEGQSGGEFNTSCDPFLYAKNIHISLSGFILNSVSENSEFDYLALLREFTQMTLNSLK